MILLFAVDFKSSFPPDNCPTDGGGKYGAKNGGLKGRRHLSATSAVGTIISAHLAVEEGEETGED